MEVKGKTIMYSHEELIEERYGPVGTPARIAYEKRMELLRKRHESALKGAETRKRNRERKLLQEMATNIIIPNTVVKENILVEV